MLLTEELRLHGRGRKGNQWMRLTTEEWPMHGGGRRACERGGVVPAWPHQA